jgi:hypothetical protein
MDFYSWRMKFGRDISHCKKRLIKWVENTSIALSGDIPDLVSYIEDWQLGEAGWTVDRLVSYMDHNRYRMPAKVGVSE